MTPGERNLMNAEIAAAVEAAVVAAVRPLRDELADLKRVDRRHSLGVKALNADIRKSSSDITEGVDDKIDAVARRDEQIVGALNEVRDELAKNRTVVPTTIAPAAADAKDAKAQATDAATEARNAGIEIGLVKKEVARATGWLRHPAVPVVAYTAVRILYNLFTGHDVPQH